MIAFNKYAHFGDDVEVKVQANIYFYTWVYMPGCDCWF